jgi:hypothetical protein
MDAMKRSVALENLAQTERVSPLSRQPVRDGDLKHSRGQRS